MDNLIIDFDEEDAALQPAAAAKVDALKVSVETIKAGILALEQRQARRVQAGMGDFQASETDKEVACLRAEASTISASVQQVQTSKIQLECMHAAD